VAKRRAGTAPMAIPCSSARRRCAEVTRSLAPRTSPTSLLHG
jgi:hypothetical protein